MTVLVTGASGHLGANLVRVLVEQGRRVRVLVRGDTRAVDGLPVEQVKGDVLDENTLVEPFRSVDVVYHLAGAISLQGDPGGAMHRTNVLGTQNVVSRCLETGVSRLIHFSSVHALCSGSPDEIITEDSPLAHGAKALAYDRTKAQAEREIFVGIEKGLDGIILNPSGVIGPYDYKPSHMGSVVLDLWRGKLPLLVNGGFNWVDVRDVVSSAIRAEKAGEKGSRYILAGHWSSVADLASRVSAISGKQCRRLVLPMGLAHLAAPLTTLGSRLIGKPPRYTSDSLNALMNHRHISDQRARKVLGHHPRPLEDTLADTIDWFLKEGIR